MSKKDYQAIARAIHATRVNYDERDVSGGYVWGDGATASGATRQSRRITEALADVLAADNPAFDRARFVETCETGTCHGMRKREGV